MRDLLFIADWDESVKFKWWSGTPYSLYLALKKYYDIYEYNIARERSIFKRIKKYFFRNTPYDFGIETNARYGRLLSKLIKKKNISLVFQFSEIVHDTSKVKTYIYIDLSVSYMKKLLETDMDLYKLSSFDFVDSKYIPMRATIQTEYLNKCAGIFTMSSWLRDYLINEGIPKNKVYHVGGGINLDPCKIDENYKKGNKILFVGRDYIRKGLPLLYEGFAYLRTLMPEIELHIAGPAINPYEGEENVFYHGDCQHDKLVNLFNMCDIFCLPSYFEAYGLVFIEALCFGLPCIGRNAFEMPFFIENGVTGFLLENADDAIILASMMQELLTDNKYKENVRNLRAYYLKEYSWENVASKIANVIS